jgi:transcriptional regulator with PAS, ATPase and Fis domain
MQDIYEVIESVADSDANILILGESGTGKEVIANAIHYKSLRAKKSFIKVNCSALPKDLIESQLFGHTRGSFTGAVSDKVGFIGQASGGSLLLDEIGEMPIELQPKLLRVLQERVYYRVGSDKPQEVDFRLICSTNREPNDAIKEGILREDLLYRINTIEIRIPPLRERMDDIPMLAEHFLSGFADKYSKDGIEFAQSAYDQMLNYSWRGNVRELDHVIERALSKNDSIEDLGIRGDGSVQWMLPFARPSFVKPFADESVREPRESADGAIASESEDDIFERVGRLVVDNLRLSDGAGEDGARRDVFDVLESEVVLAALKRTKGNKQAAANLLGLYRPRLYGMIRRHKLDVRL